MLLGATWGVDNRGLGNGLVADIDPDTVNSRYGSHRTRNVCVVMCGLNNLFLGQAAADIYADLETVCAALQAYGWQVVVCTVTAANQAYGAESRRLAYNALIRAGWAGFADALADVGLDSDVGVTGAESNGTYFMGDQIHLTAAGYAVIAGLVEPEILGLP